MRDSGRRVTRTIETQDFGEDENKNLRSKH